MRRIRWAALVAVATVALVPAVGVTTAGATTEGLSTEGLSTEGLSTAGLSAAGLSAAGVSAAGLSAAGVSAAAEGLAVAGAAADGDWWYTAIGVPAAHAGGYDGAGVDIAVIDGSIYSGAPALLGANLEVMGDSECLQTNGQPYPADDPMLTEATAHGADVVAHIIGTGANGSIAGVAPGARVKFYAVGYPSRDTSIPEDENDPHCSNAFDTKIALAVSRAVADGVKVISISMGQKPSDSMRDAIAWALHNGIIVVASLPNRQSEMDSFEVTPALYSGVVAVGAVDESWQPALDADTGLAMTYPSLTVRAPGVGVRLTGEESWKSSRIWKGTSFATPVVAGMLALVAQKYPGASGWQLVQSLIRNTGSVDHELTYGSDFGYGTANLRRMLAVDPARYPDVNPLLVDSPAWDGDITASDVRNARRPAFAPAPSASPSASSSTGGGVLSDRGSALSVSTVLWVLVVVVVLVVGVVVVLVVRRRARARAGARAGVVVGGVGSGVPSLGGSGHHDGMEV